MLTFDSDISKNISRVLNEVHNQEGRDSATTIGWSYFNNHNTPKPTG